MSPPRTVLDAAEIERTVARLGAAISADHPDGVVIVGVLKGGLCFVADLLRAISVPCVVDFFALSAYAGERARVRILKDVNIDVAGLDVVLAEDTVDTGLSAHYLLDVVRARQARRVRVCALLDRPRRRIVPCPVDYVGIAAPDDFLVGYGLDAAERYRNVPLLAAVDPTRIDEDRTELAAAFYGDRPAYPTPARRR